MNPRRVYLHSETLFKANPKTDTVSVSKIQNFRNNYAQKNIGKNIKHDNEDSIWQEEKSCWCLNSVRAASDSSLPLFSDSESPSQNCRRFFSFKISNQLPNNICGL